MRIFYRKGVDRRPWTDAEDRFLILTVLELGYGKWKEVQKRIRTDAEWVFDWFFKSRTEMELKSRFKVLARMIERNEKAEQDREKKSKGGKVSQGDREEVQKEEEEEDKGNGKQEKGVKVKRSPLKSPVKNTPKKLKKAKKISGGKKQKVPEARLSSKKKKKKRLKEIKTSVSQG
eukprot:762629-Hanusia_phi.AAC.3